MDKQRPFGVTLLAILVLLAGLLAVYHALQLLGILPFMLGEVRFYTPDASWIGALLWGLSALIYVWVSWALWQVKSEGWLFVVVLSALNLVLAAVSILGASSFSAMLPSIILNGIILLYCLLPATRDAFGT